jgi:hypothetical protein
VKFSFIAKHRGIWPAECRRVRLHRALLQFETQALQDRLYESHGVREASWISLSGCHPNRVQPNEPRSGCRLHFRMAVRRKSRSSSDTETGFNLFVMLQV